MMIDELFVTKEIWLSARPQDKYIATNMGCGAYLPEFKTIVYLLSPLAPELSEKYPLDFQAEVIRLTLLDTITHEWIHACINELEGHEVSTMLDTLKQEDYSIK